MDIPFLIMGSLFLAQAVAECLFPAGSGDERLVIKLLCGVQVVFALVTAFATKKMGRFFQPNSISVALLLLLIWLCLAGMIQVDDRMAMLYACVMFLYWYSMFLFFYVRSQADPRRCRAFLIIVAGSLFVWLFALRNSIVVAMEIAGRPQELQIQNYLGYYMVALFPYVLLVKSKTLKVIAMALISFGAIYSLKRGAVLALVLMGIGSSCLYLYVLPAGPKRVKGIVALLFFWGLGMAVSGLLYRVNPAAIERRIHGRTDDRTDTYSAILAEIAESNLFELLVGHGYLGSSPDTRDNPHNDWLLLQYDYGAVGVVLMLNVYRVLCVLLWRLCRMQSPLAVSLVSSIILLACVQMYSMGLYIKTFGFITGSIGLVAGCFQAGNVSKRLRQYQPVTVPRFN
jgi:hypothetical protein